MLGTGESLSLLKSYPIRVVLNHKGPILLSNLYYKNQAFSEELCDTAALVVLFIAFTTSCRATVSKHKL